jgi:hypothetical protein
MDRLDWYRRTLIATAETVAYRLGERTAGRAHLRALRLALEAGGFPDRETERRLKQWSRRYRPRSPDDRLGHLVRTVVAASALLQSLEGQHCSPTTPVLRNVARLAHFVGVRDPVVDALAPGQKSYPDAVEESSVAV